MAAKLKPTPAAPTQQTSTPAQSLADIVGAKKVRTPKPPKTFAVTDDNGGYTLVRATNSSKAKLYVASSMLRAALATHDQIYEAGRAGIEIHDAVGISIR
jgi:hypothetical protein